MSISAGSMLPLFIWLSPSFPVGAYAYSHGLEWAVEAGDVRDARTCESWISDLVIYGSGRCDAALLACAYRAVTADDAEAFAAVAGLARALAPSRERRLETLKQGEAFLRAIRKTWPAPKVDRFAETLAGEIAFPVAVGVAAAAHDIALVPVLEVYLVAFISNLVSAAVRLVPLGQTDGTRIVATLAPIAEETATRAAGASLESAANVAFRSDIASMRHEVQHTRLFRS